jgi:hypothetical protein
MRRSIEMLSALSLVLSLVACGYDNDGKERVDAPGSTVSATVASIDTDAKMTNLESGVGMFIEYASGGTWTVQFACDTAQSKTDCQWDVYAYTPDGGRIYSYSQRDLESNDYVTLSSSGELRVETHTTTDLDGVEFVSDDGEPITFDVVLADVPNANEYLFWTSDGEVVQGADTAVVDLTPTKS